MADKYILNVTAGPNYTDQKQIPINTEQPTHIDSPFCSANITARVQNYRGLPAVSQYNTGAQYTTGTQYVSPAVTQYSTAAVRPVVTQYSVGTTGSVVPAVSQYSAGSSGQYSNSGSFGVVGTAAATPAQFSSGQYSSGSFSYGRQEPASVAIKVTSEPSYEASTASSLAL